MNIYLSELLKRMVLLPFVFCVMAVAASEPVHFVMDASGKRYFNQPLQRVVVTNWTFLEQVIELNVNPIGGSEIDLYRCCVRQPSLPDDIGSDGRRL